MRSRLAAIMTVAAALISGSSAQAQPIQYFFTDSTGHQVNNFNITTIGGTVTVNVFIHDTDAASSWFTGVNPQNVNPPGSETQLNPNQTANLNTYGLRGSQFQITSSSPTVSRVNAASNVTGNALFNLFNGQPPFSGNFAAVNSGAGTVQVQGANFATPGNGGIAASVSPDGGHQVFVGSFVFTAIGAGTTTLSLSDFSTSQVNALATEPVSGPAQSNGGAFLDATTLPPNTTIPGLFSSTATITVTPVPEPTSMVLGGIGLLGCGLVRRFRRKS